MRVRTGGVCGVIFAGLSLVFGCVGLWCNWEVNSTTSSTVPPVTDRYTYSLWSVCRKVSTEETKPVGISVETVTTVLIDECGDLNESGKKGRSVCLPCVVLFDQF